MRETLRSAFCEWNNPEWDYIYKHNERGEKIFDEDGKPIIIDKTPTILNGRTPQEICEFVVKLWCDTKPGRTAACSYCVSATGLHHLHFVLECPREDKFRFATIWGLYGNHMFTTATRGNKRQAEDYIYKQGDYAEAGEIVLARYQFGEIQGSQGNRSDLEAVSNFIDEGLTPAEIYRTNFRYRRYDKMIREAFFDKKAQETPVIRDLTVYWHYGASGSGKTYEVSKLIEDLGEFGVYPVVDYQNGGFDHYCGQPVLFMDEFRGQIQYHTLLSILNPYKFELHCRNTNTLMLWNEVHITSPFLPDELYEELKYSHDSIAQLLRRISFIIHHTKTDDGRYLQFKAPMSDFNNRGTLSMRSALKCLESAKICNSERVIDKTLPY